MDTITLDPEEEVGRLTALNVTNNTKTSLNEFYFQALDHSKLSALLLHPSIFLGR